MHSGGVKGGQRAETIFFLSLIFSCLAVKPGFHLTPPSELLIQLVREDLLGGGGDIQVGT